jgi:sugar lactone lactonase YvrE
VKGAVLGGIAIAADGAIYMACYRPDAVVAWNPSRGLELIAHDPEGAVLTGPIALSFADDQRELAVANTSAWSVSIMPVVAGEPSG